MSKITLPDGSSRQYDAPTTAAQVAADIGPGLAKAALGAKINGQLCDLSTKIDRDCTLALVTPKSRDGQVDADALSMLRHSCAHIMAEAIAKLFPGTMLVYGPSLDTGFYYDMAFPSGRAPSTDDFVAIESEMAKIIAENRAFTRSDLSIEAGMTKLNQEGSKFKIDNAQRAKEAGSTTLSWYATGIPGTNWEDLCRGPHVPSTGRIGAFKITSLASSYWKGDETLDRLTRVYGTAFATKPELEAHLKQLEEAKKRDHRMLGKQLRLFHIDEMVGQGLVLWTPRGAAVRQELQTFISEALRVQGYQQVFTPHIGKLDLYKTSGHFPFYRESQYPPIIDQDQMSKLAEEGCTCGELSNRMGNGEIEGYLLKPMNCPHHIRIYASEPHSYRDLPVRLSEFGTVYRWEQSGEIGGLTRVRGFTQDDAHLFVREDQIAEELQGCLSLVKLIFGTLGMNDYRVRVGLRDPQSDKYVGDSANWDKAEEACRNAARSLGVPFTEETGEAAFYGPKIDFIVRDVIGRSWQLGTVQVDYNLPIRFDLSYIGADNKEHRPVMIHRAPFGSMERFVGVLIEHFAGAFPLWLAPEQVRVLPISEKSDEYAQEVLAAIRKIGLRATIDSGNERVQARIRDASEAKIPYLAVVGPRDAQQRVVSVRAFGTEANLGELPFDRFITGLNDEYRTRGAESLKAAFPV
ncbi:MAG: threonine--tRNA ligase [Planctomycetota bacterium]|nr:threonine--tRNA ligase [Planctomycetota bacterium]MDA1262798.1 threonine--tRNA ligase [Planctomycetota bacterium]